jgi:selenoprotein W-related protein
MLRAAWMAQELLSTFAAELGEVALRPGTGGVFEIHVEWQGEPPREPQLVWSRAERGGFPEIKALKQLVRDLVAPDKQLGHADRSAKTD